MVHRRHGSHVSRQTYLRQVDVNSTRGLASSLGGQHLAAGLEFQTTRGGSIATSVINAFHPEPVSGSWHGKDRIRTTDCAGVKR